MRERPVSTRRVPLDERRRTQTVLSTASKRNEVMAGPSRASTVRWVESRTGEGALDAWGVVVPFPVPAHRTGREDFPQGSPTGFIPQAVAGGGPRCIRRRRTTPNLPNTTWSLNCNSGADERRTPSSASAKILEGLAHVVVDRPVRPQPGPVGKVIRPARQHSVETMPRTSSQRPTSAGRNTSRTFRLSRATLFLDGLAPKYQ